VEQQQRAQQQKMKEMEEKLKEEKVAALNQMEQEKKDRQRKLDLQKEYEEQQRRQREQLQAQLRQRRAPQAKPVPSAGAKLTLKRKLANRPFEPETETEEQLLDEYLRRPSPDEKLPKVSFVKRNGVYWLGQRRFTVRLDGSTLVVEPSLEAFSEWVAKSERVEALRLRGMQSASTVLSFV